MNEIVICGNEQQRSEIRCRLKPCDANLHFMNFCEEEMLSEEILSKGAIWIAADDLQERMLLEAGVCEGEIINYKRFEKTTYENPIAAFACDDDEYTGLIFGMSHSQCAIDESLFTNETYCKVAAPSLDLFLQRRFMEKLSIEHPAALKKIRHIIIELPYYIFNYDLSRFGSFVYTKLKYFEIVGDYHHFGKTEEQQLRISEFNHFLNLFTLRSAIRIE